MNKYIGRIVEIIYLDRAGHVSQRRIRVHDIRGGLIRATCLNTGKPRAFREQNILACVPVKGGGSHAS